MNSDFECLRDMLAAPMRAPDEPDDQARKEPINRAVAARADAVAVAFSPGSGPLDLAARVELAVRALVCMIIAGGPYVPPEDLARLRHGFLRVAADWVREQAEAEAEAEADADEEAEGGGA